MISLPVLVLVDALLVVLNWVGGFTMIPALGRRHDCHIDHTTAFIVFQWSENAASSRIMRIVIPFTIGG